MELQIKMVGIDHNKASIEYRELFSFTKSDAIDAMKKLKSKYRIGGCIILSTCNRTELWLSGEFEEEGVALEKLSPYEMLCDLKGVDPSHYQELFIERQGEAAAFHLLKLTSGMDSKIFGEDQIISQVREGMILSRKNKCIDMVLEKVFQTAIGAAKKVKSQVQLGAVDGSTALQAISLLKDKLGDLKDVSCFIIGNGQMGKLTATALIEEGAKVKMTLRKKIHGEKSTESMVLEDCKMIPYENRIQELANSDVVISATRSPHHTLKKSEVEGFLNKKQSIWIDMAVPRDIEPTIDTLDGITIIDIDHLGGGRNQIYNTQAMETSIKILEEYLTELMKWFAFLERVPEIQRIIKLSVEDVTKRICPLIDDMDLQGNEKKKLQMDMEKAVEKTMGKLLFGLKDTLRDSLWQECLEAMNRAARKDTLKS